MTKTQTNDISDFLEIINELYMKKLILLSIFSLTIISNLNSGEFVWKSKNTEGKYEKKWKCPYCHRMWSVGKPCQNEECPSKYFYNENDIDEGLEKRIVELEILCETLQSKLMNI